VSNPLIHEGKEPLVGTKVFPFKLGELGVCLDTGHANLTGDIYSVIHKLSGHLRMVHAHDNRGDGDEHLAPGAGLIDWNRVLTELDQTGFHGGIILELSSMIDTQQQLAEARKGKRFLRDIGRRLALSRPPTARAPGIKLRPSSG
jgi:sugar phosphate isomerase/epimerase